MSEEKIEAFRHSGIRLDAMGRFWHDDALVTHERFQKSLLRWLDLLPNGQSILRLDETRYAYLEVEDAHLLVRSVQWEGNNVMLVSNDESRQELVYDSVWQNADHRLYCKVRNLRALFSTQAYFQLAEGMEERSDEKGNDYFVLCANGQEYPIAKQAL